MLKTLTFAGALTMGVALGLNQLFTVVGAVIAHSSHF